MRKLILAPIVALALAGCSAAASSHPISLVDRCVQDTVAMYKRHNLPFTAAPADRPGICASFLADQHITTAAQLEIAMRIADKQLTDLGQ